MATIFKICDKIWQLDETLLKGSWNQQFRWLKLSQQQKCQPEFRLLEWMECRIWTQRNRVKYSCSVNSCYSIFGVTRSRAFNACCFGRNGLVSPEKDKHVSKPDRWKRIWRHNDRKIKNQRREQEFFRANIRWDSIYPKRVCLNEKEPVVGFPYGRQSIVANPWPNL